MAEARKLSLNWAEIDRSIISAISVMQVTRDYFKSNSAAAANPWLRSTLSPPHISGRTGSRQSITRDEQVSICFDDAERMLEEVRARIMTARAILSGAPQFELAAAFKLSSVAELDEPKISWREALSAQWARMGFAIVERAKRNAVDAARDALQTGRRLLRHSSSLLIAPVHGLLVNGNASAVAVTWRNVRTIPVQMRSHLRHWHNQLRTAARIAAERASSPTGGRPFQRQTSFALGGAALALLAGCALAAWLAAGAILGVSATAQDALVTSDRHLPRASATYSSCSVAAWGKACYPRRGAL